MHIIKNTTNTVYLTLTELVSIENPVFLFSMKSQASNTTYNFIAENISSATTRIDKFLITENVSEDLLNGTVSLNEEGWYDYVVYEQASSTNLIPANAGHIVESGLAYVKNNVSNVTYTDDAPSITFNN